MTQKMTDWLVNCQQEIKKEIFLFNMEFAKPFYLKHNVNNGEMTNHVPITHNKTLIASAAGLVDLPWFKFMAHLAHQQQVISAFTLLLTYLNGFGHMVISSDLLVPGQTVLVSALHLLERHQFTCNGCMS